jgi:quercetin dioxygenase-like cupin family protein
LPIICFQEPQMLVNKTAEREWKATAYPESTAACSATTRRVEVPPSCVVANGPRFPRHAHEGTEEVMVLEGDVSIGGVEGRPGDYLFTTPGKEHGVVAVFQASIIVSSQKSTPIVQ